MLITVIMKSSYKGMMFFLLLFLISATRALLPETGNMARNSEAAVTLCNEGFAFCEKLSVCFPSMCLFTKDRVEGTCPSGYIGCGKDSCIQNQCLSLVVQREDTKTKKLLNQEKMEKSDELSITDNYEYDDFYDIEVPVLRKKRQIEMEEEEEDDDEYTFCPFGTSYCMEKKECSANCGGDKEKEKEDDGEEFYTSCPPGTDYCMEERKCMQSCGLGEDRDDLEEEEGKEDDYYMSCPPGTSYCMTERRCVPSCDSNDEIEQEIEDIQCPIGTVYCMDEERCSEDCGRQGMMFGGWNADDEQEEGETYEACPIGQIFCMEIMACVSNCNFFDTGEPDWPDEEDPDGAIICPQGTVYCMSTSRCIPNSQSCEEDTVRPPDHKICPLGLVWCGDGCQRSCDEDPCPPPESIMSNGFSSCQISSHCPTNASCCPDSSGTRQCLMDYNNTMAVDAQLEKTCSAVPLDLAKLAGSDCSEDPTVCSRGSVCCDGLCHGLPTQNETLFDECIPGTFLCNISNECLAPFEWSCGVVCGPGMEMCVGMDTYCAKQGECEGDVPSSKTVWMFPMPAVEDSFPIPEIQLKDLWKNLANTYDSSNGFKIVGSLSSPGDSIWEYGSPDVGWKTLAEGVEINGETFLRLNITSNSPSGVAWFDVKEMAGGLQRRVVQSVFPSLDVPSISTNRTSMSFFSDEDVTKDFNFEETLILNEAITTRQKLKDFQMLFQNWITSVGPSFLDGNFTIVQKVTEFLESGERPLGYHVEMRDKVSKKSEYKSKLYFFTDTSDSWTLVNPSTSLQMWLNDGYMLQLRPEPEFSGELALSVKPIVKNWDGNVDTGKEIEIILKIQAINDAPTPNDKEPIELPLVPYDIELNTGVRVKELADLYYDDIDNDNIGIGIVYADTPNWGTWQYSTGNAAWKDIVDLGLFPVPEGLKLEQTFRGPVPITEYMTKLACHYDLENVSLTSPDEVDCWKSVKQGKCTTKRKTSALRSSLNLAFLLSNQTEVQLSDEGSPVTKKIVEQLKSEPVSVILLNSSNVIRFNPKDGKQSWSTFEAMAETRIMFTGWDGTQGTSGDTFSINLPFCCQCDGASSLARDVALFYIEKEDCGGGPVITESKVKDQCGVCGGDGTSCLDCNDTINGVAVLECGTCYPNAAAAATAKDCAGACSGNVIVLSNDEDVCVPEDQAGNFTMCDGQRDSDARINDCGVCYGGNTGLVSTEGYDDCEDCIDETGPPPECENCEEVKDDCGVCNLPNTDKWNACQKKFSKLNAYSVDTIDSTYVQIQLINAEMSKQKHKKPDCKFSSTQGTTVAFDDQEIRMGFVMLGIKDPEVGQYIVSCVLYENGTAITYETGQNDILYIFNSFDLEVKSVALEKEENLRRVSLVVKNLPSKVDELACLYRKSSSLEGGLMRDTNVKGESVDCGTFNPMGGGIYQFGAVLVPSKRAIGNPKLSVMEEVIVTDGPAPTEAYFTKNLGTVEIKFDKNLQGSKGCEKIFDQTTLSKLGEDPTCGFIADLMVISMGTGVSLQFGDSLIFVSGNGIIELQSTPEYANEVTGSVTIIEPEDTSQYAPDFTLSSPSEICSTGSFNIQAGDLQGFGRGSVNIDWDIQTDPPGATGANISKLKSILLASFRGSQKFQIPASLLSSDITYSVTATGKNSLGLSSQPKTISFIKRSIDTGLSVKLIGPRKVYADRNLEVKAEISQCNASDNGQPSKFRYFWTADGPLEDLSKKNFKSLKLEKGSLEGGRSYNFSVVVISEQEDITGSAFLIIEVDEYGPVAKLAANKVMYGTKNEIVLDATLSEDRDNSNGKLKFEWFCKTTDGSGCFVYKEATPKRLEEHLLKGTLKRDYVVLDSNTLVPGSYEFTVTVSKNNLTSSASMEIEIVPGNPPTISPIALENRYKPDTGFTINAIISGAVGTCVQWASALEDGYVYLDISELTKSSEVQCFVRDIPSREFPLVIPPAEDDFSGLEGGAKYKFIVTASHPTLGITEASVVVETHSPPQPGKILIKPSSGIGVKTMFSIEASEFQDEDVPLFYSFGYRHGKSEKVRWFKKISSSIPTIKSLLPSSKKGIIIVIEVCDAFDTCTTIESIDPTQVSFEELTTLDIMTLGGKVAKMATNQECTESLSLLTQIIETVSTSVKQKVQFKEPLCSLHNDIFGQCSDELASRMDCMELDNGRDIMDFLVDTECQVTLKSTESGRELSSALKNKTKECSLDTEMKKSAMSSERLGFSFEMNRAVILNSKKPTRLFGARRKRGTIASMLSNIIRTLSGDDIEQYMDVALTGIKAYAQNFNSSLLTDDMKEKYRELVKELLKDIHENYMAEMCKSATTQSPPETVRTKDIKITMVKTEMNEGADEKFIFDQTQRSSHGASSFKLKDDIYEKYSEWDCGKTSRDGKMLPCVGLCLGTAILTTDFVSPTSDRLDVSFPPMVSNIHDIRLLNPVNGEDLTPKIHEDLAANQLDEPIALQLNIDNSTKSADYTFKCMVFVNDAWSASPCETEGITPLGDGTALINCNCNIPGYIAVFLTLDNKPLVVMPTKYSEEQEIHFTIHEDYETTVGDKKTEFEANLRKQLAVILGTEISNVRNLRTWPGSVEVSFNLVAPTELDAGKQKQAMEEFSELIASGKLDLSDLNGESMNVPMQCVQNCPVEAIGEDIIPIIIAAVAMAIILFIVIFIICAVCMKKKKTEEKLKPLTPPSQAPTYRSFQFADSLEGTQASLARNRKNSSVPEYMPSNFNSRIQTQSSCVLHDDLNEPNSGILVRDPYGVPIPARYKEPTRDEINLTQPIPDHIVRRSGPPMPERLPGTPEGYE